MPGTRRNPRIAPEEDYLRTFIGGGHTMFRFLFGALGAVCFLAPAPASAQVLVPRRVSVVSYYPAPVVTTTYLAPAPVVTYDVAPVLAPVIASPVYPAP